MRFQVQWLPSLFRHNTGNAELSERERGKGEGFRPEEEMQRLRETAHVAHAEIRLTGGIKQSGYSKGNPGARGSKNNTFCYILWL